jgi:ADP-ribose pyrophosphatase YjhB (NUDIX family)
MKQIDVLKEKIKSEIINQLLRDNLTYSEILKNISIRDSGKFNYHLKNLINSGLVEKQNEKYKLTLNGEKIAIYLKQYQLKELYPLPVICLAIINNNKILLAKKATKPIKGFWVLPGGKQLLGETIKKATLREIEDELGVKGIFKKIFGIYPTIVKNNNKIQYHAYLIVVLAEIMDKIKKSYLKLQKKDISEVKYFDFDKINIDKIALSNREIIKDIINLNKNFIFKEQKM